MLSIEHNKVPTIKVVRKIEEEKQVFEVVHMSSSVTTLRIDVYQFALSGEFFVFCSELFQLPQGKTYHKTVTFKNTKIEMYGYVLKLNESIIQLNTTASNLQSYQVHEEAGNFQRRLDKVDLAMQKLKERLIKVGVEIEAIDELKDKQEELKVFFIRFEDDLKFIKELQENHLLILLIRVGIKGILVYTLGVLMLASFSSTLIERYHIKPSTVIQFFLPFVK